VFLGEGQTGDKEKKREKERHLFEKEKKGEVPRGKREKERREKER